MNARLHHSAATRHGNTSIERAAAHALEIARNDLADGRTEIARRLLEALIARYPDALSAHDARRDLYALYRADTLISARTQAVLPSDRAPLAGTPGKALPDRTAHKQDAARTLESRRWQTSIFPQRALQAALRDEAGDRIFFAPASADIGARSRSLVQAQAQWLLRHPHLLVRVEGHADDRRSGADNQVISSQRAQAVRLELISAGIEPHRIISEGIGARDPIAECDDNACAAQNRRVILHVGALSYDTRGYTHHIDSPSAMENGIRR